MELWAGPAWLFAASGLYIADRLVQPTFEGSHPCEGMSHESALALSREPGVDKDPCGLSFLSEEPGRH